MTDFKSYLFIEDQKIYLHSPQGDCPNRCRGNIHITSDLDPIEPMFVSNGDGTFKTNPKVLMGVDWGK